MARTPSTQEIRMFRRIPLFVVLSLSILPALLPGAAAAYGHPRTVILNGSGRIRDIVGYNASSWKRFELGLRPGMLDVSATVKSFTKSAGPTYGIAIYLSRGKQALGNTSAGCPKSTKHCNQTIHLRYSVRQAGVYELLVQGLGADGIRYTMSISGNTYPLR
jgi:hypothetical protein